MSPGLSDREVYVVVEEYLGKGGDGSLAYFTRPQLTKLLLMKVGLAPENVNPHDAGNKMDFLSGVMNDVRPAEQLAILEAIVDHVNKTGIPPDARAREQVAGYLRRLRVEAAGIVLPSVRTSRDEVVHALDAAATLLREHGAAHALGIVHTAFHGYLREKALEAKPEMNIGGMGVEALLAHVRESHSGMAVDEKDREVQRKLLKLQGSLLAILDDARDDKSLSHSNPLLQEEEATLLLSSAAALFRYLDAKLGE